MAMLEVTQSETHTHKDKSPSTRLLDMMAGWAAFVSEEEIADSSVLSTELNALYQEAGQLAFDNGDTPEEAERVREFMEKRVLPLLLRGA